MSKHTHSIIQTIDHAYRYEESKVRWGNTQAYKQSQARTKNQETRYEYTHRCSKKACQNKQISFKSIGESGVFLSVEINDKNYHFIANSIPLNNSIVAKISKDKGHSYDLLNEVLNMPKTCTFLDPYAQEPIQSFAKQKSREEIAAVIQTQMNYPVILKKNSGSQGMNVFKFENKNDVLKALETIFNQASKEYDYVALAQEYLEIENEYRVTVLNNKIELIYVKDNSDATFNGNLSPLHWDGAIAKLVDDTVLLDRIKKFIQPIFSTLDLEYGGLDIVVDSDGVMWLLEANTNPAYNHLVEHTNQDVLVELYEKILTYIQTGKQFRHTSGVRV